MSRKGVGRIDVPSWMTTRPHCCVMKRRESPACVMATGNSSPEAMGLSSIRASCAAMLIVKARAMRTGVSRIGLDYSEFEEDCRKESCVSFLDLGQRRLVLVVDNVRQLQLCARGDRRRQAG